MDIRHRTNVRHFTTNAQRTSHARWQRQINGRRFYFERTDNVTSTIYTVMNDRGREIHHLVVKH